MAADVNEPAAGILLSAVVATMPLYELLCLARPLLARDQLQRMIEKVGGMVYSKGGVVTNVVSYGKQPLAYKISGVHGKFDEVSSDHISCCGCIVAVALLDTAHFIATYVVIRWTSHDTF